MKSYLVHPRQVLLYTIIVFLAMFLYATEEKTESYYKANLLYEDSDQDGIENYFDPCPYNEFTEADLNKDGCPNDSGLIVNSYKRLEQINPVCKDKQCNIFKTKIKGVQKLIKPLAQGKILKQKEQYADYINQTKQQAVTQLDMLCPQFHEQCKSISPTLASIIKEIKQFNAN